jgi:hypothetical protein
MNDWDNDWFKWLDQVAEQAEAWCLDMTRDAVQTVTHLVEWSDEMLEKVEEAIAPNVETWDHQLDQLDEQLQSWVQPFDAFIANLEQQIVEASEPVNQTLDPILQEQTACVGCRHYHGQRYGDTMLICAMHPYGWDDDKCPDWESTWRRNT